MIIINNNEEMEKYFDEGSNTYILNDDVTFTDNIETTKSIKATGKVFTNSFLCADNITTWDITAMYVICMGNLTTYNNLYAKNIRAKKSVHAVDIMCDNITSEKIRYENICCAREKIDCPDIKGKYEHSIAIELKIDLAPNYIPNSKGDK